MADDEEIAPRKQRRWPKIVGITLAAVVGILVLLAAGLYFGLNSDPGRRLLVRQINQLELASGLDIDIGRIEGSIYGDLVIHDLVLRDPKGVFFTAPRVALDYRPFAYFNNHIDIRSLVIPEARLTRLPELISTDPDAPLLPDIDIDIGRLQVGRVLLGPAITGQRHLVSLDARAKIADGRAQVAGRAATISAPGMPGGDRLAFELDAVPEANRFDLEANLQAPTGGLVTTMAGLDQPVEARISGEGTWSNWRGRAQAALGGEALANLAIAGREGTFTVEGRADPALLLAEGPARRLVEPMVDVELVTTLEQRRADLRLKLRSNSLAVAAEGLVDLGQNQFRDLKVAGQLLTPGAIAPGLTGRNVRIAAVLNGPFATPFVAYDLQAGALGFDGTVVEGLRAQGRAKVDADRITLPISARASRITGLNEAVGGLLTNVAIDGSLFIEGATILSDNLRIRSDKLNATAVIVADVAKGMYRAALDGRINNYQVRGIGLLDITSDLDVTSGPEGFGLAGRVAIRTKRIDNASARDFLGGNATITADVRMNPAGTFSLGNLRLNSPQLRITSGSGTYDPDGRINLRASGVSDAYGPLSVVVTGTTTNPQVDIKAANPNFGIGLRNVDARIRSTGRGYAITATGESGYGPFSADIEILSGRGPLTINVNRLTFAGFDFQGRVTQTAAGVFAGQLSLSGSGLQGTVMLSAAGQHQRVHVEAFANGARIPSDPPILIQRAAINATAILYPEAPQVVGSVRIAGLRWGDTLVRAARAEVNYQGGRGRVQLVADGRSGVPFSIAANAALTPELIRVAMRGSVNNIDFRLAQPADIRQIGQNWVMSPTALVLRDGRVLLAGRYGEDLVVQARLRDLKLSIFNAFSPGLGLGGQASGSVDFVMPRGSTFPRAELRLKIDDFTRAGVTTLSEPVDIAMAGRLVPQGGSLAAVIRDDGNVIGRLQARLEPLPPGAGSWTTRLLAAPLAGGIRYNGPAQVIWTLSGLTDQQLSGQIGIAADFSGRVQDPDFAGIIRSNNLTFVDQNYGTRITNLAVQGRFDADRLQITQLSGRAGEGTITGRGTVGLAADAGFPIDVRLNLDNARLARGDALGATATGEIAITNGPNQPALISGELRLPQVRYQLVRQAAAEVIELEGVRRKGQPLPRPGQEQQQASAAPSIWNLDLRLRADNEVFISGMGLESEWETDLRVTGTSSTPRVVGSAEVIRGTYSFAGNRFEITDGEVTFTGSQPIEPRIRLSANTEADNATITVTVTGSSTDPQINFSSNPSLPQDEILARLLFGGSITELSALQVVQLGASLNALRGGGGGLNPLGKLRSATGIDRLRILGSDEATGRGTAISAGFYISNDIYIDIITDARGFTATQLEIALSRTLSLLSVVGSSGGSAASLQYRKEY